MGPLRADRLEQLSDVLLGQGRAVAVRAVMNDPSGGTVHGDEPFGSRERAVQYQERGVFTREDRTQELTERARSNHLVLVRVLSEDL